MKLLSIAKLMQRKTIYCYSVLSGDIYISYLDVTREVDCINNDEKMSLGLG